MKDKFEIEVTLNNKVIGQTGKQKHRRTKNMVWCSCLSVVLDALQVS